MRQAYALMGILTLTIAVGSFVAFYEKAEAPITLEDNTHTPMTFTLTSPVFEHEGVIPSTFTCDGQNISPELNIAGVPEGTKSLVLIMDDPDVPKERRPEGYFDHWVVYNIPPSVNRFGEGAFNLGNNMAESGMQGKNGRGEASYTGPCPPTEFQPTEHRYFFRLYATDLETLPQYLAVPGKLEILSAIEGHTLGVAELMGRYDRAPKQ